MTQWTVLYLYLLHSNPLSELSEVHETQTPGPGIVWSLSAPDVHQTSESDAGREDER